MRRFTIGILAACAVISLLAVPAPAQRRGGRWYGGGRSYGWGGSYYYGRPYGYGRYGGYSPYFSFYSNPGEYYYPGYNMTYTEPNYSGSVAYNQTPMTNEQSTSFYADPNQANRVMLNVILPDPSAKLIIQNQPTQAMGNQRTFMSPPLDRGSTYTYTLRATWNQNGQQMSREKKVDVQAGQHLMVDFNHQGDQMPAPAPNNTVKPPQANNNIIPHQ